MHQPDACLEAEAVARRSYGKLIALLAARDHDVAAAEDALSEAFAAALESWPRDVIPANPEAWLMRVAQRRMIDMARRKASAAAQEPYLLLLAQETSAMADDERHIPDHRLALMFACAHPALDAQVRAPLILQAVLGFDAAMISAAFMVAPATMSQRLVRAKTKIRQAGIPFRVPDAEELPGRLATVLDAIYAVYAEGWPEPGGAGRRHDLAQEGIWLARLVGDLMPDEPEALGLLALMLHAEARRNARRDGSGAYVPLAEQDVRLWRADMIAEAEATLLRASRLGRIGRYQLEAAVQSAHAARRLSGKTDWSAILTLYDALIQLSDSPVLVLNRAVALSEIEGPAAALLALDAIHDDPRLADYQSYWAARARLLAATGAFFEADTAYAKAIELEPDPAVRDFLRGARMRLRV
ncbi:RNA polymerase sigma factor [Methylovirgula sp. 4M-Z18]|uniref:RNA polymerase sigma factor n=1 Tax=Methylovirgula sp. 4M-Z18 TaxID=2293567 RepID=UPI000E2EB0D2|nr:DUF6596 domain-containing protein [Methylovirgula sp. 4M-Z18]RFB78592.1 RNA polymerase subunit sigma-70 [Methylovirgula sp. 4M-Z18]